MVVHLAHGNIAQVFEMGEFDGQYFMAMEYVEGKTLAKVQSRLKERNELFPLDLALLVAARLCEGLAYAHRKTDAAGRPLHVVHRDISPSNVMITYDGDLKIIDFGAALSTLKEEMTAPRVVIGNLSYMAPEHARKLKVDQRADIFSAGVVLWELITQQTVPAGGDHVERWKRAARPSFQKPSALVPGLPPDVDQIVIKALQPDPRDRYQDADAMRADLQLSLARHSPTVAPHKLAELMLELFDGERRAERRIISDALEAQPTTEPPVPSVIDSSKKEPIKKDAPPGREPGATVVERTTDPENEQLPKPPRSANPFHSDESTVPATPARGHDPSRMATTPGRPPLFPDDPLDVTHTAPERRLPPPVASSGSPSDTQAPTDPLGWTTRDVRPRLREPPPRLEDSLIAFLKSGQLLWVFLGLIIGFGAVLVLLSTTGRH